MRPLTAGFLLSGMIVYAALTTALTNVTYTMSAIETIDQTSTVTVGDSTWSDWLSVLPSTAPTETGDISFQRENGDRYSVIQGCTTPDDVVCVTRVDLAMAGSFPVMYGDVLSRAEQAGWTLTGAGCEAAPTTPPATVEEVEASLCSGLHPSGNTGFDLYVNGPLPTIDIYVKGSTMQHYHAAAF